MQPGYLEALKAGFTRFEDGLPPVELSDVSAAMGAIGRASVRLHTGSGDRASLIGMAIAVDAIERARVRRVVLSVPPPPSVVHWTALSYLQSIAYRLAVLVHRTARDVRLRSPKLSAWQFRPLVVVSRRVPNAHQG